MRERIAAVVAASICLLAALPAMPALAHDGDPNYRSEVRGLTPAEPGVSVEVLNYDDSMRIVNSAGRTLVIEGYDGEPYARMLPDGSVQRNERSPATYLNDDRYAATDVPDEADPEAPPRWVEVSDDGVFDWHDHRMHWMGASTPPQVTDEGTRTKVFDYRIPVTVDGEPEQITGSLFWVGTDGGSKAPFLIAGIAVILLGGLGVLAIRRRRDGPGGAGGPGDETREAW